MSREPGRAPAVCRDHDIGRRHGRGLLQPPCAQRRLGILLNVAFLSVGVGGARDSAFSSSPWGVQMLLGEGFTLHRKGRGPKKASHLPQEERRWEQGGC